MTKRFRKILSILCAIALLLTCTGPAFADGEQPDGTGVEVTDVDFPEEPSGDATGETGAPAADQEPAPEPEPEAEPEPEPEADPEPEEEPESEPEADPEPDEVVPDETTVQDPAQGAEEPKETPKEDPKEEPKSDNPAPAAAPADNPAPAAAAPGENPAPAAAPAENPAETAPSDEAEPDKNINSDSPAAEDPAEEQDDPQEEESDTETTENLLNLNDQTTIEGVLTKNTPFTFTVSDDYFRTLVFTLTVPEEDCVTVICYDKSVELTKAENPNPESTKVLYTFEEQTEQNSVYSYTLTTDREDSIAFTINIEEKKEEIITNESEEAEQATNSDGKKSEEKNDDVTDPELEAEENNDGSEESGTIQSIEVYIKKSIGINNCWKGYLLAGQKSVLKLEIAEAQTVHLLIKGQYIRATVQKSDDLIENPVEYLTSEETNDIFIVWDAEAGNYLITLEGIDNERMSFATVISMDDEQVLIPNAASKIENEAYPTEQEDDITDSNEDTTDIQEDEETEKEPDEEEEPKERSVTIQFSWRTDDPALWNVAHFTSEMNGYENLNYTLQWQNSWDKENWKDYEGATSDTLDVRITEELNGIYWRLVVFIEEPQEE